MGAEQATPVERGTNLVIFKIFHGKFAEKSGICANKISDEDT